MTSLSSINEGLLRDLARRDVSTINKIINLSFDELLSDNKSAAIELTEEESNFQISLSTCILSCCRNSVSSDSFQELLKNYDFSDQIIGILKTKFDENIDLIRAKLSKISFSYQKIVSCDWKLDYLVSDSESGSVLKPMVLIQFITDENKKIRFTCNEEELTTFVTSLREINNEVNRVTD